MKGWTIPENLSNGLDKHFVMGLHLNKEKLPFSNITTLVLRKRNEGRPRVPWPLGWVEKRQSQSFETPEANFYVIDYAKHDGAICFKI